MSILKALKGEVESEEDSWREICAEVWGQADYKMLMEGKGEERNVAI